MAFIKKLWKDRISQFPNRRTINDGSVTKQVTVGRDEGTITEPGDTFDASNMNDLEQRIEDAYGDVVSLVASEVAVQYHGDVIFDNVPTASHGVGYAVTSDGLKTALDSKADTSAIPDELNDLSDVDINNPTQGEALVFDEHGNIVNGIPKLDVGDLDDVTITTPSNGDIIVYNNGTWVNVANPASTANFAPDYDDTATYNTNDKVIYNNLLYVCLDDNVTGAWDSTKWQQISTADYNASNLPISANDPTDTKSYIDSKVATTSGAAIAQTGVTIGSKNLVYKQGIFCYICLVLTVNSNLSAGDNLVKLPFAINTNQYIVARKEDGTTIMLTGNGEYIKTEFSISSGTILRIGETTLAI